MFMSMEHRRTEEESTIGTKGSVTDPDPSSWRALEGMMRMKRVSFEPELSFLIFSGSSSQCLRHPNLGLPWTMVEFLFLGVKLILIYVLYYDMNVGWNGTWIGIEERKLRQTESLI